MSHMFVTLGTVLALCGGLARAQDGRPVAFINARLITIAGETIENGTLVVRDGKIFALGADAKVPAGTAVLDMKGKTIMPGLVSAWSRAGLSSASPTRTQRIDPRRGRRLRGPSRGRSSSSKATNAAAKKVADSLYARQDIFGELLELGVTTLSLVPMGTGFPGTGAVLDPSGKGRETLVEDDDAFLLVVPSWKAADKKMIREAFEKAKKVVEERKKPPAPPEEVKKEEKKKEEDKGKETETAKPEEPKDDAKKPAPGKEGEKKPEAEPDKQPKKKKKDPNIEVLADLLEGNKRSMTRLVSAADVLHFVKGPAKDLKYPTTIVVETMRSMQSQGLLTEVKEELEALQAPILMPPSLSTVPRTTYVINPAADLHRAGFEIGFLVGDDKNEVRGLLFNMMQLVRHGLPREVALAGITSVPAKALGVDSRVGSLAVGKRADLLVFDGDPLDPRSRMLSVWRGGKRITEEVQR